MTALAPIDKAIAILAGTRDGAQLTARQLRLTERAANGSLSERGLADLDALYASLLADTFDPTGSYLFGIEYLTRDGEGYVYWKGRSIEHYSHQDEGAMKLAAEALAQRCLRLEAKGFPVTGRTVLEDIFEQVPSDTQWLEAMQRFYALFEGGGRHVAILYRYSAPEVIILERDTATGELKTEVSDSAFDAYHHVRNQGLKSTSSHRDYGAFVRFLETAGFTPQDIQRAIA